ncbi:Defensin-like protein [Trifolium repens]|nr:Defensin-like protein [Trifolium repens]
MYNQISNYLLSLILVLYVLGRVKGDQCSQDLGGCVDTPTCNSYCKDQWSGGNGACAFGKCICYYTCGGKPGKGAPKRNCEASPGPCSKECGNGCCNNKCASRYNQGVGYCNYVVPPIAACSCQYVC